jgi:hypothetical protein
MIREIRLRYERDGDSIPPRCVIRSNHYSSQLSYFNEGSIADFDKLERLIEFDTSSAEMRAQLLELIK